MYLSSSTFSSFPLILWEVYFSYAVLMSSYVNRTRLADYHVARSRDALCLSELGNFSVLSRLFPWASVLLIVEVGVLSKK